MCVYVCVCVCVYAHYVVWRRSTRLGTVSTQPTRMQPPYTHTTTTEDDEAATRHDAYILKIFYLCWVSVEVLTAFLVELNRVSVRHHPLNGARQPVMLTNTAHPRDCWIAVYAGLFFDMRKMAARRNEVQIWTDIVQNLGTSLVRALFSHRASPAVFRVLEGVLCRVWCVG